MEYGRSLRAVSSAYPALQFAIWRILFGLYLLYYFVRTLPYGRELFSSAGVLPEPVLPSMLRGIDSPLVIDGLIAFLILLSALFTLGIFRRFCGLLLWVGWMSLFGRDPLIDNPAYPFVGWMMLAAAIVPRGEPLSIQLRPAPRWYMPSVLYWGAWLLLGAGYTVSGFYKCLEPTWRSGYAMLYMYGSLIALDSWLRDLVVQAPLWITKVESWSLMLSQLLALPAFLFKITRLPFLVILTVSFLVSFVLVDLTQVILGMLVFHILIFPHSEAKEWLGYLRRSSRSMTRWVHGLRAQGRTSAA